MSFSESYYLTKYPDIASAIANGLFGLTSGLQHYLQSGRDEGRQFLTGFSEEYYLAKYPDVAAAVAAGQLESGVQHYALAGQAEGRQMLTGFSEAYYLAKYPDVAAAVASGQLESAVQHYALAGQAEGRQILTGFSEAYYLAKYPDVAAAVAAGQLESAVQHYALAGQAEGRQTIADFNEAFYLAAHPDVAAAVASGQLESGAQHFALAGQAEGRAYLPYAYKPVDPVVPQPEVEGKVFTLKQSTVDITETVETITDGVTTNLTPIETIKETYWGNGEDNGVPVANLTALITQYFSQKQAILELFDFTDDMAEIAKITLEGVQDQVQDESDTDTVDVGNNSDASVGNDGNATNTNNGYVEVGEGDYTGTYTVTVTLADGSTLDTQVELTAQEYEFFTSVLFNADGTSRLFEVVTNIYPEIILKDTAGNPVLDADGNPITYQIQQYTGADITEETEVVTGSRDVPLVLTTAQNNGSTEEGDITTTAGDDLIVVGRLDLLHGAYIDAGAGFNTLEIDAKGYFAQPKQLLNIQQIHIQNLPNIYTDVDADGNVINQYPDLVEDPTEVHANSIIDLSRAIDVVNVKITEGAYTGLDNEEIEAGTLTVTGVRSDATLMLEGAFTQTVNINYSTGLGVNNDGINVVLRLGDVAPDVALNFAHNANTININSQGGGNVLADANFGNATLTNMNISGDAKFVVVDSIAGAFTATHVATINASANTAGVDLTVSGRNTDDVVFVGTQAADSLTANNNRNVTIDSGAGNDEIVANDNQTVMISAASGNNQISATATVISATVTAEDGNNQVDVSESAMATVTLGDGENQVLATVVNVLAITLGDGENQVVAIGSTESVAVTLGNGDNTVNLADGAKVVVVAGNGDNAINANNAIDTVTMTLGDGANQVTATEVTGASVTITAGNGGNTIDVSDAAGDATITTGTGDDVIVAEGMGGDVTVNAGAGNNDITIDINNAQTVTLTTSTGDDTVRLSGAPKLVMDLGAGENTLTLAGVVAQPGSSITGSNIKLVVTAASDLTNVDLTGVTSVVLSDLDALSTLRLTDAQFAAIGAANFSVAGSVFTSFANLEIIVTENNSLTAMGADSLSGNVNLVLEIADGATLTMTAEQLHTKVAPQGVGLLDDANNEDVVSGKVVVTGGGLNFDPFNTSDVVKSVIAGNEYNGGSLSNDFMVGTDWYNVTVQSTVNGYDRPADALVVQVLTLDSGTGLGELTQPAFTTSVHNNLSIVGERDIQFTGDINLGENFTIDFSQLEGQVLDMSITQFQDVKEIHGNGDATIHVKLENRNNTATERTDTNGAAAEAAEALDPTVGQFDADGNLVGGLISSGISNIVVTDIVDIRVGTDTDAVTDEVAIINLCDQSADLEVVALRANYDATLVVNNAAWGVNFELQGGSTKKADGPTATSNVGALIANYEWDGADAVVNLVHSVSGDTRTIKAYGITINNADSITINTGTASALVDLVEGDSLNELVVTSDASVTIGADMAAAVTTINASGVDGNFTVASDVTGEVDFTFVGSAANTSLTLNEDYIATADSSFTSAGNLTLIVGADSDVDLTAADVSGISAVVINTDASLALTIAQAEAIGTANFSGTGSLTLSGLGEEPFAKSDYDVAVTFDTLEVIDQAAVELHADTDLTGIATLLVNAGTTLSLTAAQFQQLTVAGTITGLGNNVTVNITDLTQADVDAGFSLIGITGATVIINLAESINMPVTASMLNADVINMPAGAVLAVRTFEELDAVEINGGANTSVRFLDSVVDNDPAAGIQYPSIDASGFNVTQVEFLNLVAGDINVDEQLFVNLPSSVTKVVYNGEGMATPVSQTVIINAGSSIDGDYTAFNKSGDAQNDVEITQFTITLAGGVNIGGDIELSTAAKDNAFSGNELLKVGLQTLVINSTGTAENIFTGETANVMGTVTPRADNVADATDNRLTDVQINATQDLIMEGIVFNSWSEANVDEADGWSINDNLAATATVTVTGDADVNLGLLDSSDNEVDALVVVNNGTGTVAAIISDASVDATDALSFTGTGDIALTVEGEVDLSNDNLTAVTQITLSNDAELTLSQAQVVALGAANIVVATGDDATLNINAFSGAVAFDAAAFDADLDIGTITLAAGTHTLTGDFTNVDSIIVPAGSVLNLTAAQFQQLAGAGTIVGVAGITAYTVNVTDLSQADIDAGTFDTTGISAATLTLTLAGNVNLSADDVIENVDTLIMADGQRLGIATATQADDLVIDGGTNTTVSLDFDVNAGANIDADGYDVTNLRVWSTAVNNSDVEAVINNLPETVTLVIVEDALQVADITAIDRQVVIEPGVAVPGFLVFNGDDSDRKLRTLEITFQGDATDRTEQEDFDSNIEGSVINGNLIFDYDPTLLANGQDVKFHTLTLNSTGVGSSNAINGDISPLDNDAAGNNINNNLLNVVVNADAAFTVNGSVIFNSEDAGLTQATLTVNGTAPVSIENLDVDGGVSTLTVNNAGTGALTITGASPSVTSGDAESLIITGASVASSITFGTAELAEDFADGIDGNGVLSVINASGFAGTLSIETVTDVDVNLFTFTAGSGETTVNFRGVTVDQDANPLTDSGFTINFANAAVGSEVHFSGVNTYTDGALNINLGANTTLYIDADTNWTSLDLTLAQTQAIVVAAGTTLTLTAAQANGLEIIGNGTVNITQLGNDAYDFSGIAANIAGTITLEDNDVTVNAATDLGDFSITLDDLDLGLTGQTIRFNTVEQAERDVIVVNDAGGDDSTNVVWLFNSVSAPVNTDGYDNDLGRLWISQTLADGANVEQLFTSLPTSIVRVEFTDLSEVNFALASAAVNRTVELVAFTDLPAGISFADGDRYEHVQSLTINMGGAVNVGSLEIDNIIAPSTNPLELDPTGIAFTSLTINSERALRDTHILAPELYVNDNDGTPEEGENVQPGNLNVIGDISVGTTNGLDLLTVNINTLTASVVGNGSDGAGADLQVRTITFDAAAAASTATLNVTGDNDVTIKSLDTSDADISTLTVNVGTVATAFNGVLTVTGGSPAAAVSNTEVLNIVLRGIESPRGEVSFGTAMDTVNNVPFAGVAGAALSVITVDVTNVEAHTPNAEFAVNLGVIAQIDSLDFVLNGNNETQAVLGTANVDGVVMAPSLAAGGEWTFNDAVITLADTVTLGAGDVTFDGVTLTIDGDIDFTTLANLTLANTTIDVPAGSSITILASDISGVTVTGAGVVNVVAVEDFVTLDLSDVMTNEGDTGTVTALVDTADGADLDALPDTVVLNVAADLGIAAVTVIGEGTLDVTNVPVANLEATIDRDPTGVVDNETVMVSFNVAAATSLILTAAQADDRTTSGAGTTNIEDIGIYANANAIDYSAVNTASVTIAVDTSVTLEAGDNLGTAGAGRVTTIATGETLTSAGSVVDGQFITGSNATLLVDDENSLPVETPITANLSNVSAEFITLVDTAAVGTITFPVLYGDPNAVIPEDVQTVTLTANQASNQTIVGGAVAGTEGAVIVTNLSNNTDTSVPVDGLLDVATVNFANINAATMVANAPETTTLAATSDLGNFDITLGDDDAVADAVVFTLTAGQADGLNITAVDVVQDTVTVAVTALEATPNADLSGIDGVDIETAALDADGDVTLGANLGADMLVTISDSDTNTADTVTFTGDMINADTTFELAADDLTLVLDAADANDLNVVEALGGVDNSTVIVNNLVNNASSLLGGPIDVIDVDFSNIVADTMTANVTADATLADAADLADFAVVLADAVDLTLSTTQLLTIGEADFSGTAAGAGVETLIVTGYAGQAVQSDALGANLVIGQLVVADTNATVIADAAADFTRVQEIVIPEGTTFSMTADQFMSMPTGVVSGLGTLNITGFDGSNGLIDLSTVTAVAGTISLDATAGTITATSPELTVTNPIVVAAGADLAGFSITMTANNQAVTVSSETQADGLVVISGVSTGTALVLGFTDADATDANANILASGFDVDDVYVLNEYLANEFGGLTPANIETMLTELASGIDVTIYDVDTALNGGLVDPVAVASTLRTVTVEANTFVDASIAFNDIRTATEVTAVTINLNGNSVIDGSLTLPQDTDPMSVLPNNYVRLFNTLTINSDDATGALVSPNVINGNIIANNALAGAESEVERFSLDFAGVSIVGSQEEVEFAGVVVNLADGDVGTDVATKLANAINAAFATSPVDQPLWYASAVGTVVTFTAITAGVVTDVTIGDFTFTQNDPATLLGTVVTAADLTMVEQGTFVTSENNLLDVTIDATHDLNITGTIEFRYVSGSANIDATDDLTATATLDVDVDAGVTVNVGALNTADDHVTGLTINQTGTGTFNVLGTSPAAAVNDTETLTINAEGTVTLGTAGDATKPGVSGADLSLIDVNGTGDVDLGVIALVDTAAPVAPATRSFTLDAQDNLGDVTAVLGADLAAGGFWVLQNGGNGTLNLTINADASFAAGSTLVIQATDFTVSGDVDLSLTTLTLTVTNDIVINDGVDLTMTVGQAVLQSFAAPAAPATGTGVLFVTGAANAADLVTINNNSALVVNMTGVTSITGSPDDLVTLINADTAGDIVLPFDIDVTLSGPSTVTALLAIDTAFSTLVDASLVTPITGNGADFETLLDNELAGSISLAGDFAAIVEDPATATQLTYIDTQTTTIVNATAVISIDGTATEVLAVINDADITTANFDSVLTGVALAADILDIMLANGTGTIDASGATSITGSANDVEALLDAGVLVNGTVNLVITGIATAAQATKFLAAANTGTTTIAQVDATAIQAVGFSYDTTGNDTITLLNVTTPVNVSQGTGVYAEVVAGNVTTAEYDVSDSQLSVMLEAENGSAMLVDANSISIQFAAATEEVVLTGLTANATPTAIDFVDNIASLTALEWATISTAGYGTTVGDTITITGTANADTINASGQDADFIISGLAQADVITGGDGVDIITAGVDQAEDVLTGGAGLDTYVFGIGDSAYIGFEATITDFSLIDGDLIDFPLAGAGITYVDASALTEAAILAIIGTNDRSVATGTDATQFYNVNGSGNSIVLLDSTTNGTWEMAIELQGVTDNITANIV